MSKATLTIYKKALLGSLSMVTAPGTVCSCEGMMNIIFLAQPTAPSSLGASFNVADGGSTTITLIPVGDDQTAQQTTPPTSVASAVSSERNSPRSAQTSSPVKGELTVSKLTKAHTT